MSITVYGATKIKVKTGPYAKLRIQSLAEPSFDSDRKAVRIGDDGANAPAIVTTKSTGKYDFSSSFVYWPKTVTLALTGSIDRVKPSTFNTASGIVTRTRNSLFANRTVVNADGTVLVTNGNGLAGDFGIQLDPALVAKIRGFVGGLLAVSHDNSLSGNGTAINPLKMAQAIYAQRGGAAFATAEQVAEGLNATNILSPASIRNLRPGPTVDTLKVSLNLLGTVKHDDTFTGNGTPEDVLIASEATETVRGILKVANQTEMDTGFANRKAHVTPYAMARIKAGSPMAVALNTVLGNMGAIQHDGSILGAGSAKNPLRVAQATETGIGGAEVASQNEAEFAVDRTRMLTVENLYRMTHDAPMAAAVRKWLLPTSTGPGLLFKTPNGVLTWSQYQGNSPFLILTDDYSAGHPANTTGMAIDAWHSRPLCYVQRNDGGLATITGSAITAPGTLVGTPRLGAPSLTNVVKAIGLAAGSYTIEWWTAVQTGGHILSRVYDVGNAVLAGYSNKMEAGSNPSKQGTLIGQTYFKSALASTLHLQIMSSVADAAMFGAALDGGWASGEKTPYVRYAQLHIFKSH